MGRNKTGRDENMSKNRKDESNPLSLFGGAHSATSSECVLNLHMRTFNIA